VIKVKDNKKSNRKSKLLAFFSFLASLITYFYFLGMNDGIFRLIGMSFAVLFFTLGISLWRPQYDPRTKRIQKEINYLAVPVAFFYFLANLLTSIELSNTGLNLLVGILTILSLFMMGMCFFSILGGKSILNDLSI
jgi:hypothetical protein